ncbi:hypothetical protein [Paenibacillus sp. HB172176]|uniref:SLAC1 family transporter n=1 Tax=Paenibacillus sp. HB172176 TaxID=2493690 RepID=UPI00197DA8D4|nr:hypothetical protein [Paenibacillus sp. HB172176]
MNNVAVFAIIHAKKQPARTRDRRRYRFAFPNHDSDQIDSPCSAAGRTYAFHDILIAPFEVGFLGYTNVLQRMDSFASLLFYFGLFLFIVLFFKVFKESVPFSPSWWAVSFPIAALSNAALEYAIFVHSWLLIAISAVILAFLSVVLIILFIRTMYILWNGKLLQGAA